MCKKRDIVYSYRKYEHLYENIAVRNIVMTVS